METNKELIDQLREYAGNAGYSHQDYADTMRLAAAALADANRKNLELTRLNHEQRLQEQRLDTALSRALSQCSDATVCTCPSGDGSLRWPCPSHPPAAAAGERADWTECERISNEARVDEALRSFSDDPTQDNATGVIQAAITTYNADRAAQPTPAQGGKSNSD